jgi:cytochrome P450
MITLGTIVLSENPDQLEYLKANPEAWPGAVEELLRYLTVAHHAVYRLALEDVNLGETCIRAGEGIIAPVQAANRDPEVFPEPDRLDVTRNARKHLAFGYGVHQCLGQTLARAELRIAFERLFRRFPRLRPVKPRQEQAYKNGIVYGVEELLVEWS